MATNKITSVTFADVGGANGVAIDEFDIVVSPPEDGDETAPTGSREERIVGYRDILSMRSYKFGESAVFGVYGVTPSQDLHAAMVAGTLKRVVVTFKDGVTWTYDPVRVSILPSIFEGFDIAKAGLLTHDAGSGAPPTGYTDQGDILGGSTPSFTMESDPDGQGRPRFGGMNFEWIVETFNEISASLNGYAGKLKLAIPLGTSPQTYITFDNVRHVKNRPGMASVHRTTVARFVAGWEDWRTDADIVFPASPQGVIFGANIQVTAAGPDQTYLTIA